jgi:hypothetical protein
MPKLSVLRGRIELRFGATLPPLVDYGQPPTRPQSLTCRFFVHAAGVARPLDALYRIFVFVEHVLHDLCMGCAIMVSFSLCTNSVRAKMLNFKASLDHLSEMCLSYVLVPRRSAKLRGCSKTQTMLQRPPSSQQCPSQCQKRTLRPSWEFSAASDRWVNDTVLHWNDNSSLLGNSSLKRSGMSVRS